MESFAQGAYTGCVRTGRAIADEAAGKETESVRGARLHFVTRLQPFSIPNTRCLPPHLGLSQAMPLPPRSFFPAQTPSKAWTFVPLFVSPPTQQRSMWLPAHAHRCLDGCRAGTPPSSSSSTLTPPKQHRQMPPQQRAAAFYFLKGGWRKGK